MDREAVRSAHRTRMDVRLAHEQIGPRSGVLLRRDELEERRSGLTCWARALRWFRAIDAEIGGERERGRARQARTGAAF